MMPPEVAASKVTAKPFIFSWNGPWHYRQVLKGHSLAQIQNRDKIKITEIEKAGYTAYVINDGANKSMSRTQVYEEFNNLLSFLN